MRKLIVSNLISLDGYAAGPGGDVMALPFDTTFSDYNLELMQAADTLVSGATTYRGFVSYWPPVADDPAQSEVERAISRRHRELEHLVVSDSLNADETGPPAQIIRKLREADRLVGEGADVAEVARHLEVSEQTYHRWRNQFGGMKADDAKRLRELERENRELKHVVADKELENRALRRSPRETGRPVAATSSRRDAHRAPRPLAATACQVVGQHRATQRHGGAGADPDRDLRAWHPPKPVEGVNPRTGEPRIGPDGSMQIAGRLDSRTRPPSLAASRSSRRPAPTPHCEGQ
jgi:hypothetical protein